MRACNWAGVSLLSALSCLSPSTSISRLSSALFAAALFSASASASLKAITCFTISSFSSKSAFKGFSAVVTKLSYVRLLSFRLTAFATSSRLKPSGALVSGMLHNCSVFKLGPRAESKRIAKREACSKIFICFFQSCVKSMLEGNCMSLQRVGS